MTLRARIQKYLDRNRKTLGVAQRFAQRTGNPFVVRIYLEKDLGLARPPAEAERRDAIRTFRTWGWTDVFFEDPSLNQITDTIAVLVLEPLGWPATRIRSAVRGRPGYRSR